jgi:ATP-dependent RNA helicase DHX57
MVKKGKDKSAPAPAPAPAAAASKGKPQKPKPKPAEDDFIVFTTGDKDPKNRRGGGSGSKAGPSDAQQEEGAAGPPKPTVKQIIGGASWTGKLPVNMLSEHCQKQKWDRPDYHTVSCAFMNNP